MTTTNTDLKSNLLNVNIWLRLIFMVLFWVALTPISWVLGAVVLVQFLIVLITGEQNKNLRDLGSNLGTYLKQIVDFLCFKIEDKPYPFSDFPSVELESNADSINIER